MLDFNRIKFILLSLIFILILPSCNSRLYNKNYIVRSGDTLYSIAKKNKINLQQLAKLNNIADPYMIRKGQKILLVNHSRKIPIRNLQQAKKSTKFNNNSETFKVRVVDADLANSTSKESWIWPAKGKIIKFFIRSGPDKFNGIDIAGELGSPVLAAANGKIVYAGNNLRGYGNLVIIKHNEEFLSAYAHNDKILVTEKQIVTLGQKIATMGKTDSKVVKLHFEIRSKGKPIDPVIFLEKHKSITKYGTCTK